MYASERLSIDGTLRDKQVAPVASVIDDSHEEDLAGQDKDQPRAQDKQGQKRGQRSHKSSNVCSLTTQE